MLQNWERFLYMGILWTKISFFFKNSSPLARGRHFTSMTQNRKNWAEFWVICAFHCKLDAALLLYISTSVYQQILCTVSFIKCSSVGLHLRALWNEIEFRPSNSWKIMHFCNFFWPSYNKFRLTVLNYYFAKISFTIFGIEF